MQVRLNSLLAAGGILLVTLTCRQVACATCRSFDDIIANGSIGVADSRGNLIDSCNLETPLIPASLIKIPTALAALRLLGAEYRFTTEFYLDSQSNLYIKGFGDPQLISEEVALITARLRSQGLERIEGLFIDDSAFALEGQTPGSGFSANPYDAPIGPVSVNFNSVSIRVGTDQRVRSGEGQTPLLPLMTELGSGMAAGSYRINICVGGCNPAPQIARYAVELFEARFSQAGIETTGPTGVRQVPQESVLLYSHENSKSLETVLAAMLKYSSNFIANLVYLTCGAEQYGYPATWDKARLAVHGQLAAIVGEKAAQQVHHLEGSGLARCNRITAGAMLKVLSHFKPHAQLLARREGVAVKSGTLKGVFNYAGYLAGGQPYVILLNQPKNTRKTVLDRLKQKYFQYANSFVD